jgi:hypothetical protein
MWLLAVDKQHLDRQLVWAITISLSGVSDKICPSIGERHNHLSLCPVAVVLARISSIWYCASSSALHVVLGPVNCFPGKLSTWRYKLE